MKNFELTTENAPVIVQAFETNPLNARSIIRSMYDITDEQFLQIKADYEFNKLSHLVQKKKRAKNYSVERKLLRQAGFFVANEERQISCPHRDITPEELVAIRKLESIGFLVQMNTFI